MTKLKIELGIVHDNKYIMDIPRPKIVITYRDQVIDNIYEWYMSQGKHVPPEDLEACREIDKEITETHLLDLDTTTKADTKPAYGTPEFWKMYWQKKKATAVPGAPVKPKPVKGASKAPKTPKAPIDAAVRSLERELSQIHISTTNENPGAKKRFQFKSTGMCQS